MVNVVRSNHLASELVHQVILFVGAFGRSQHADTIRTVRIARLAQLQAEMKAAAANLEFEKAATLRDRIKQLRSRELGLTGSRR